MNQIRSFVVLCWLCFGSASFVFAQDFGSWTSVQFSKQLGEKITIASKPILIHNQDFNNHAATFLDNSIKYKINDHWHLNFLTRNFFVDEGSYRHFLFFDVAYGFKVIPEIKMTNAIRYHLAPDINISDADFLRWHTKFQYKYIGKFAPYIANQFFYRLNGLNFMERLRTNVGIHYKFSDHRILTFELRREGYDIPLVEDGLFIVTNFHFKL